MMTTWMTVHDTMTEERGFMRMERFPLI